jgi:predicted O-methyltransferase YrrM
MNNSLPSPYIFTNNWFSIARPVWEALIPQIKPTKILEIGSYEGNATCFLIETLGREHNIEIHCVDTWEGGIEHSGVSMGVVKDNFMHNTSYAVHASTHKVSLVIHNSKSDTALTKLLTDEKWGYFDFIYIDGSHQAPDVLLDALLAFRLLRIGGLLAFDDYLWSEQLPSGIDPLRCPKMAIDTFTTIYARKVRILPAPLYQLYVQKISD